MIRSIRWKLLALYSVILLGLAAVFGTLLFTNVRHSVSSQIDSPLREHATALTAVLLPDPDGTFSLDLSQPQIDLFDREELASPYYRIWNAAGFVVDSSHPEMEIPHPKSPGTRDREKYREVITAGPGASLILVGREVAKERQRLRELLLTILAAGIIVLLLMFAGGWFLTGKALAPIERITRAAAAVSASNLSQRIDVSRMESELAHLATTINQAFERLELSFDKQTRFTADASHELRTPLAIILSQAELALRKDRSPEEYRQALEAVHRAGVRMRAVIDGLLTLARADSGRLQLRIESIDLKEIVLDAATMLAPLADGAAVTIHLNLCPAPLQGDKDRLGEAVTNLLSNAIRYNNPGGRVGVTLSAQTGAVALTIADTGIGIPPADHPHIFERFYRADKTRSRAESNKHPGGSGLGLTITQWIANAHGGTITFTSLPGEGSTFVLSLPQTPDKTAP